MLKTVKPLTRITPKERQQARLQNADVSRLLMEGIRAGRIVGNRIEQKALTAFRQGKIQNISLIARREIDLLGPLIIRAMIAAHLRGVYRTDLARPQRSISFAVSSKSESMKTAYSEAISFLSDRLDLKRKEIKAISEKYNNAVLEVVSRASGKVEKQLQRTIRSITENRLHVRDGIKELKETFERTGISPRNSFELEAIFRTQTQLAYSAGRWNADKDADIQEILWGYKYVTVGDDRVREEHAALEGMTLPKDDPRWLTMFPPNGWACRCQAIPIFEEREIVEPPTFVESNGRLITPEPDKGFNFNAGEVFGKIKSETRLPITFPATAITLPVEIKPLIISPILETTVPQTPQIKNIGSKIIEKQVPKASLKITLEEREEIQNRIKRDFEQWQLTDRTNAIDKAVSTWIEDSTPLQKVQSGKNNPLTNEVSEEIREALHYLDSAYESAPKFEGTIYRGLSELTDERFKELTTINYEITTESWQSFTWKPGIAESFSRNEIGKKGNEIVFQVKTSKGLSLEGVLGNASIESEVLIPKDSKYIVKRVDKVLVKDFEGDFKRTVVVLQEL